MFDAARFKLARQARGLRKSELARLLDVTPATISQVENRSAKPSLRLLAQASLALAFPIRFFAADPNRVTPVVGEAFFRSLRSTRRIDRDQAEAHAALIYDFARVIERYVVFPDVRIPRIGGRENLAREAIEDIAQQLREYWSISTGPIPNMVRLLEANGAIVAHHEMGHREVDAFSRWFDSRPVIVLGSDKGDLARRRFDAAHELGHLVLHEEAEPGTHTTEYQANVFAAAFLMPTSEIRPILPKKLDWKKFVAIKQEWGVSIAALLFRCRELSTLTEATYRRAMTKMSMLGWRYHEPAPLNADEMPTLFQHALELTEQSGISVANMAKDSGFPEDFLEELLSTERHVKPRIVVEA